MAETAVSLAGQHALPKILEAVKMLRDLPKEVRDITDELESFQDFINDANKVAEAEEDDGRRHRRECWIGRNCRKKLLFCGAR